MWLQISAHFLFHFYRKLQSLLSFGNYNKIYEKNTFQVAQTSIPVYTTQESDFGSMDATKILKELLEGEYEKMVLELRKFRV